MRIDEFASAEEQLALWKLVSDNVWSAIATQATQERRAQAEKAARSKPKRGKRKSVPKSAHCKFSCGCVPVSSAHQRTNSLAPSAAAQIRRGSGSGVVEAAV